MGGVPEAGFRPGSCGNVKTGCIFQILHESVFLLPKSAPDNMQKLTENCFASNRVKARWRMLLIISNHRPHERRLPGIYM